MTDLDKASVWGSIGAGAYNYVAQEVKNSKAQNDLNLYKTFHNYLDLMATANNLAINLSLMSSGNKYAAAIGAAKSALDSSGVTTAVSDVDANFFGGDGKKANAINVGNRIGKALSLPGIKSTDDFTINSHTKNLASGMAGSMKTLATAEKNAGQKTLFGRKDINNGIRNAADLLRRISVIDRNAQSDFTGAITGSALASARNLFDLDGSSLSLAKAHFGRNGMKIEAHYDIPNLDKLDAYKKRQFFNSMFAIDNFFANLEFPETHQPEETSTAPEATLTKFQNGGTMNVIPEGNLHARLHHMENDENITKKGIPVVDNHGTLQAEIELNEIIFTLEVTKLLEELWNKYKKAESEKDKNEIALQAGLLLETEILDNTDDRTGLIEEVEA